MTVATKVSSCVDCRTPIIGERPRCPACHDQHAALVVASRLDGPADDAADDAVTAPRPKQRERGVNLKRLARWGVAIEVFGIIGLALVLVVKGCS